MRMTDEPRDRLLAIGQFARLCRLSIKQLRHYDDLGLLRPAWVDPDSSYRYYRPDQARDALSIGLLRSLDVPLAAIAEVLAGERAPEVLIETRQRLDAELVRRRSALGMLDRLLADGLPRVAVSLVEQPAQRVAAVREPATPDRIAAATGACVGRLLAALAAAGTEFRPPMVGLFPLDLADEFAVVVTAQADRPVPGTLADVLPGGVFATATHVGPYDQITLTGHGLLAWCGERGHRVTEPLREVYLTDPNITPSEQLVTRLQIRVEDK